MVPRLRQVGHAGTLDPLATGLLIESQGSGVGLMWPLSPKP